MSTIFPPRFMHWQLLNGKKVSPISMGYEMYGAPVSFDTKHLCKKCHQTLPQHDPQCTRARSEARVFGQERKRKIAEAKEKRDVILAKAAESGGEIKICELFMIGLCYEQQQCIKIHPSQTPESYSAIACAIEEPTAERKIKLGSWQHCKKGAKCLYNHTNYSYQAVLEGRKKHKQIRAANKCDPQTHSTPPHTSPPHTIPSTQTIKKRTDLEYVCWQDGERISETSSEQRGTKRLDKLRMIELEDRHACSPPVMTLSLAENIEGHMPTSDRGKAIDSRQTFIEPSKYRRAVKWSNEHRRNRQNRKRQSHSTDSRPRLGDRHVDTKHTDNIAPYTEYHIVLMLFYRPNSTIPPNHKFDSTKGYPGEGPPAPKIKIATYNVAGLKQDTNDRNTYQPKWREILSWAKEEHIDALCIQEHNCGPSQYNRLRQMASAFQYCLILAHKEGELETEEGSRGGAALILNKRSFEAGTEEDEITTSHDGRLAIREVAWEGMILKINSAPSLGSLTLKLEGPARPPLARVASSVHVICKPIRQILWT